MFSIPKNLDGIRNKLVHVTLFLSLKVNVGSPLAEARYVLLCSKVVSIGMGLNLQPFANKGDGSARVKT